MPDRKKPAGQEKEAKKSFDGIDDVDGGIKVDKTTKIDHYNWGGELEQKAYRTRNA